MKTDSESTKPTKWSVVKKKMKRVLYYSIVLFGIIACIFIYWKYFYTYSTGYRAGLLQKFSHKGNIIKTYEGEMILSSITGNAEVTIASEKFFFRNQYSIG